jgi:hypothetical protein
MPTTSFPKNHNNRDLRKCKNLILQILIDRVPNNVRLELILRQLPTYSEAEIFQALEMLNSDGKIISDFRTNPVVADRILKYYKLTNPSIYPNKETFTLGDQEYPRIFAGDTTNPEDMMEKFEALQTYLKTLEQRYSDLTSEMTKKYWLNMTTIFGLFIALFSLIIKGSEPILIDASQPIAPLLLIELKFAQLLPLALIMFSFVLILRFALRKL